MSLQRVFHSDGMESKTIMRTKYSAPVTFLFCNILHDSFYQDQSASSWTTVFHLYAKACYSIRFHWPHPAVTSDVLEMLGGLNCLQLYISELQPTKVTADLKGPCVPTKRKLRGGSRVIDESYSPSLNSFQSINVPSFNRIRWGWRIFRMRSYKRTVSLGLHVLVILRKSAT